LRSFLSDTFFVFFYPNITMTVLRTALSTSISLASFAGLVLFGSLLHQAPAQSQTYLPGYTTTGALGGNTLTSVQSSFGFYFDTNADLQLDGLGFSSQAAWSNGTSYTVKLWSYVKGGANPSDYTEIASKTFTHGTSYTFQDGYFWQALGPISLPDTFTTDLTDELGYVIGAIGDFSAAPGNVQFETATPMFNPNILNAGNGFTDETDPLFKEIPFYPVAGVGTEGYFNPNLSLVPGPLPVLGAAAGFGWSRRLRQRIRASK